MDRRFKIKNKAIIINRSTNSPNVRFLIDLFKSLKMGKEKRESLRFPEDEDLTIDL
jgi:hypothetical protein